MRYQTVVFDNIGVKFTLKGKCIKCGKRMQKTQEFYQTQNPWNRKTRDEIMKEECQKSSIFQSNSQIICLKCAADIRCKNCVHVEDKRCAKLNCSLEIPWQYAGDSDFCMAFAKMWNPVVDKISILEEEYIQKLKNETAEANDGQ